MKIGGPDDVPMAMPASQLMPLKNKQKSRESLLRGLGPAPQLPPSPVAQNENAILPSYEMPAVQPEPEIVDELEMPKTQKVKRNLFFCVSLFLFCSVCYTKND